jgi:hypothetical protein
MSQLASRNKTQAAGLPPNVVSRHEEYGGFKKGDRCYIDGDRDGRYEFKYADVYASGTVAATIWGGPPGHAMFRTPGIDRLLPASGPSVSSTGDGKESPWEQTVGDIRGRREALKWSRGQLSTASGVGVPAIASLEAGKQPRDGSARARVLAALDAAGGGSHMPEGPGVFDQVVTAKFGVASLDELAALGADPFDEEDDD